MNQHELSIASNSNIYYEEEQTEAMEAEEVLEQTQVELAEPTRTPLCLETVQSLHPPSEKPNSREGLTSWILTAGDDRITRNRVFIYAAVVAEAHSVFICIFIRVCYPQQRSSAECCVGREFQDHCFWYPTSYLANC